jgi:hypothetical protein
MKKALFILMFAVAVHAGTIVAPNGLENVEGDTSAIGLFGGGSSSRTQVIYSSQQFTSLPREGVYITALRFRMDGQYADSFSASPELEIRMSTTLRNPNGLSADWADNIGANETVVVPRSFVPISSGSPRLGGPNSFSIEIPFPTRFRYLPTEGNLLMDARVFSAAGTRNLDWKFGDADGVSVAVGPLSLSSAITISQSGLITQFVFEPIPEPSCWSLVIAGLGGILLWRKYVST